MRETARAASGVLGAQSALVATSRFRPATRTAAIIAEHLAAADIEAWDCLTPTDGGTDLSVKVANFVKTSRGRNLVLVGHHPRLSQMLERITGTFAEIEPGMGIWIDAAWSRGKVVATGAITALATDAPGRREGTAQTLSLVARLAEGLDTLAQLEAAHPMMGARIEHFTTEIKRVCEVAYDHLLKTLNKIAELSSAPSKSRHQALMSELAGTHDHRWFKDVAKICDALAALRLEFGDTLSAHVMEGAAGQQGVGAQHGAQLGAGLDRPNGLELMIDAIYEGERSFEHDIAAVAYALEESLRQSQRSGDIFPTAEAASRSRAQIKEGLSKLRVAANQIIGSGKEGSKVLAERAEEVLREDPYFIFKAASLLLVVLLAAGAAIAAVLPFYMFPLITGFALTGVIVVSALQLRASGKVPDATFMRLMELALLKFFAPLTRRTK